MSSNQQQERIRKASEYPAELDMTEEERQLSIERNVAELRTAIVQTAEDEIAIDNRLETLENSETTNATEEERDRILELREAVQIGSEKIVDLYHQGLDETEPLRERREGLLEGIREETITNRRKAFPNLWQTWMPTFLGGWSTEELQTARQMRQSAGYGPGFSGRFAPESWGGWSDEQLEAYSQRQEQKDAKTSNESLKPQTNNPKEDSLSWWGRYMPTWLGGRSKVQVAAFDIREEEKEKVMIGVSVGDLRRRGFSDEEIHNVRVVAANAVRRMNTGGLAERLSQSGQPITVQKEDYQGLLTDIQMNEVFKISQENGGNR